MFIGNIDTYHQESVQPKRFLSLNWNCFINHLKVCEFMDAVMMFTVYPYIFINWCIHKA